MHWVVGSAIGIACFYSQLSLRLLALGGRLLVSSMNLVIRQERGALTVRVIDGHQRRPYNDWGLEHILLELRDQEGKSRVTGNC